MRSAEGAVVFYLSEMCSTQLTTNFVKLLGSQYFIAFPSRASADRFWCAVQSIGANDQSRECRRHSSQFYTVPVLPNNIETDGWSGDDRRSCFVHPISEDQPAPVAPPDNHPDNKNGGMLVLVLFVFAASTILTSPL